MRKASRRSHRQVEKFIQTQEDYGDLNEYLTTVPSEHSQPALQIQVQVIREKEVPVHGKSKSAHGRMGQHGRYANDPCGGDECGDGQFGGGQFGGGQFGGGQYGGSQYGGGMLGMDQCGGSDQCGDGQFGGGQYGGGQFGGGQYGGGQFGGGQFGGSQFGGGQFGGGQFGGGQYGGGHHGHQMNPNGSCQSFTDGTSRCSSVDSFMDDPQSRPVILNEQPWVPNPKAKRPPQRGQTKLRPPNMNNNIVSCNSSKSSFGQCSQTPSTTDQECDCDGATAVNDWMDCVCPPRSNAIPMGHGYSEAEHAMHSTAHPRRGESEMLIIAVRNEAGPVAKSNPKRSKAVVPKGDFTGRHKGFMDFESLAETSSCNTVPGSCRESENNMVALPPLKHARASRAGPVARRDQKLDMVQAPVTGVVIMEITSQDSVANHANPNQHAMVQKDPRNSQMVRKDPRNSQMVRKDPANSQMVPYGGKRSVQEDYSRANMRATQSESNLQPKRMDKITRVHAANNARSDTAVGRSLRVHHQLDLGLIKKESGIALKQSLSQIMKPGITGLKDFISSRHLVGKGKVDQDQPQLTRFIDRFVECDGFRYLGILEQIELDFEQRCKAALLKTAPTKNNRAANLRQKLAEIAEVEPVYQAQDMRNFNFPELLLAEVKHFAIEYQAKIDAIKKIHNYGLEMEDYWYKQIEANKQVDVLEIYETATQMLAEIMSQVFSLLVKLCEYLVFVNQEQKKNKFTANALITAFDNFRRLTVNEVGAIGETIGEVMMRIPHVKKTTVHDLMTKLYSQINFVDVCICRGLRAVVPLVLLLDLQKNKKSDDKN